jgi:hypothetical protein
VRRSYCCLRRQLLPEFSVRYRLDRRQIAGQDQPQNPCQRTNMLPIIF